MSFPAILAIMTPIWAIGLVIYVRLIHGIESFGQEWLDAAAMGCIYMILICFAGVILNRLLAYLGNQTRY